MTPIFIGKQLHIDTKAADIADFIESECRSKNPILVGHDGGGINGYHFCRTYPEMVQKFVAISAPTKEGVTKSIRSDIRQIAYTGGIMKCPEKHVKDIFFT